jgi:hypothetical protein
VSGWVRPEAHCYLRQFNIHLEIGMCLCDALLRDLSTLIGEECWGAVCGEGTGSVLGLYIGVRTLKRMPTNNPHLSQLVRLYDSAYSFLIWCPWRIDSISKVVAGSHMSNANGGPMVEGSQSICGQRIVAVTCSPTAFDLRLDFENRYSLVIHCGAIGRDYEVCYSFGTPNGHYRIDLDGELSFEALE